MATHSIGNVLPEIKFTLVTYYQKRMDFAEQIQRAREKKGYSQEDVARLSGLSVRSIVGYERGERVPTLDNALVLADILDVWLQESWRERIRQEIASETREEQPDYTADQPASLPKTAAVWTDTSQWPTILIEHADTGNLWFGIDLQPVLVRFDPLRVGIRRGPTGDVNNGKNADVTSA